MKISEDVYIIGGGSAVCFGLSEDPDCHVYLVDTGSELVLIDCGTGDNGSIGSILQNIANEGFEHARLTTLILTHYHVDHAGGAARFRAQLGLRVIAPRDAAVALQTADEEAVGLNVAKQAGLYRSDYLLQPVVIDQTVEEGDRIAVGSATFLAIETPGHCDGHMSYLLHINGRRYMFAGDAVFQGGRIVLQNIRDCDVPKSAQSIEKLALEEFEALLPGHGGVVMSHGRIHVERARQAFRNLNVPDNLV